MERRKLSESEITAEFEKLDGWALVGHQISKSFTFDCYQKGLVFANAVGLLADKMDHHPDLFIGYQRVQVSLNTHDVDGISPLDFELARRIEERL